MIKAFSVPPEMHVHTGPARVFDFADEAVHALVGRKVTPGDVLVIRYEGPRANGMPEMYYAAAILSADAALNTTTALCLALKEGWIAGAGLDDIEEEPAKQRDWKPVNPLFSLDNVVITPHAAYYSEEAIRRTRRNDIDAPSLLFRRHGCSIDVVS